VAATLAVNPWTGVVTAAVSFDREVRSTVEATVVAEDSGVPPRSATARLIVTVRDLDDERPAFRQRRYTFRVAENQLPGSSINQSMDFSGLSGATTARTDR